MKKYAFTHLLNRPAFTRPDWLGRRGQLRRHRHPGCQDASRVRTVRPQGL